MTLVQRIEQAMKAHNKIIERQQQALVYLERRLAAHQGGANKYEGPPCRNGHSGMRYTSTTNCVDCVGRG